MKPAQPLSWQCVFWVVACLAAGCLQTGCTKSGEAKTRAAQEAAFRSAFGFAPPASITEIKYADYYQREVMDGSYEEWLVCTFQAEVFDKMIKTKGYQHRDSSYPVRSSNTPAWWPAGHAGKNKTFMIEGRDGPSYRAHLWHDQKTGFVYWHQVSWTECTSSSGERGVHAVTFGFSPP